VGMYTKQKQTLFFTYILLHVHPLLGNELVNKFPRGQILGTHSVSRLRNNREAVFSVWSAPGNSRITGLCNPFLNNGTVNTYTIIDVLYEVRAEGL
jgi:hypothetical protein